ncbi:MAG: YsnF/AvaK domain-containing protein, partial [Nocardioidaceae bacterium]
TTDDGYDRSETTTDGDDAMTRSEERVEVGTQSREAGRARLRKYVVTENVTETVPVRKEKAVLEREPVTDANADEATSGADISEAEHDVVLHEERPVVQKTVEPVERVRLGTEEVQSEETVTEEVRKEQIETDGDIEGDNDRRS